MNDAIHTLSEAGAGARVQPTGAVASSLVGNSQRRLPPISARDEAERQRAAWEDLYRRMRPKLIAPKYVIDALEMVVDPKRFERIERQVDRWHSGVPTVSGIIDEVAREYRIGRKDLLGKSRIRSVTVPRQIAMYLAVELTKCSVSDIARRFGGFDHTTILHAVRATRKRIETDVDIYNIVAKLRKRLEPQEDEINVR